MTNKFWFLVNYSLKKKMKTKWFVIVNIILLVSIVALVNIDSIITFFGGDFNDTYEIEVLDEVGVYDEFQATLEANSVSLTDTEMTFEKVEGTLESAQESIKDTDKILVYFTPSDTNYLDAKVISDDTIDGLFYQGIASAITLVKQSYAMSESDINPEVLASISAPATIERIILNEQEQDMDDSMTLIMGTVFPTVILPFFMLVIFLIQMIGTEINDEKSSRSMEIIISNVRPKVHFFSKILSSNIFIISQGLLLIIYAVIGMVVRNLIGGDAITGGIMSGADGILTTLSSTGIMDKLIYIIPITLVLMVLSFIAYALVAGILASMTVNMDDYQQIQGPILVILLVGYYLAIMASMFKGSILIRVLSYIPFISCLLSPALLVIGEIGIVDCLIAIALLIVFIYFAVKYGLRIYKVGILNYSTDKMWMRILKAARTKEK